MNLDEPLEPTCPKCGGEHINWRLQRSGPVGRPSARAFVWQCRDCDTSWLEDVELPKPEGGAAITNTRDGPPAQTILEENPG